MLRPIFLAVVLILPSVATASTPPVIRQYEWEYVPDENQIVDDPSLIAPDEYVHYTFSLPPGATRIHYEMAADHPVDLYLMSEEHFAAFEKGAAFSYYAVGSQESTSHATQTVDVSGFPSGPIYVILDNSHLGTASPGVPIATTFSFEIVLGYSLQLTIPQVHLDGWRSYTPAQRRNLSAMATTGDALVREVAMYMKRISEDAALDEVDTLSNALAFVQSLPNTPRQVTATPDGFTRFPIETLVDNGGDCEDNAILYATIVQMLGFGAVLIRVSDHLAVGVLGEDLDGWYYEKEGERYYYAETTGRGWRIGEIPIEYESEDVELIDISELEYVSTTKTSSTPSQNPPSTPTRVDTIGPDGETTPAAENFPKGSHQKVPAPSLLGLLLGALGAAPAYRRHRER